MRNWREKTLIMSQAELLSVLENELNYDEGTTLLTD